jgi:hypothetical protein
MQGPEESAANPTPETACIVGSLAVVDASLVAHSGAAGLAVAAGADRSGALAGVHALLNKAGGSSAARQLPPRPCAFSDALAGRLWRPGLACAAIASAAALPSTCMGISVCADATGSQPPRTPPPPPSPPGPPEAPEARGSYLLAV